MIERAPTTNAGIAVPRAEGCFFQRGERARFGWIHRPAAPAATGIGMVIVAPFGYEAICSHRSLRHLAEASARAGLVAIRVDIDGTGDSIGDDLEAGRLDAWLASINDACDLARQNGVDRIVLAGVRLGATLATLAAVQREDIAGLVAIAAVPSGKSLVREGRALQMQLGLAPAPAELATDPELHELIGFALTAETRAALSAVDLLKLPRAPAPAVLLLDRDDLAANDKWAVALRALGVTVDQQRVSGYVDMVLDPHRAVVPTAIIEAVVGFARARPALTTSSPSKQISTSATTVFESAGAWLTEEVVALDDCMIGIATRVLSRSTPSRATPSRPTPSPTNRAVILLNAGATYRIGPNRLHVTLARRLAARGDLVLRVDLSGIGDSKPRRGADDNVVYGDHAVSDVGVAVAWAKRQGAQRVAVVGLCSGAYHAHKAAVAEQPIDVIVPINPLTFFWKPGMPLDFAAFRVTAETARYQKSMKSIDSWRKLLRGDVNVVKVAKIFAERARATAEHRVRDVARRVRIPLQDDLGTELLTLSRRDVAMHFVFAGDEPGHDMLVEQGGFTVDRLVKAGKLVIDVIAGPDHTFTPRWSHGLLLDAITRALS